MANRATLVGHEFRELSSVPILVTCFAPEAGKVEHPFPLSILGVARDAWCGAMSSSQHKAELRMLCNRKCGCGERLFRMALAAVIRVLLHKLTLMVVRVTVRAPVMGETIHACS